MPASVEYVVTPEATIYAQVDGPSLSVSGSFTGKRPGTEYLYNSAFAFGYLVIDYNVSIADILRKSQCMVRSATHDGRPAVLLEGTGRYGSRKLWLDPARGYLPLRIEARKGPADLLGDKPVSMTTGGGRFPEGNMTEVLLTVDNVRHEEIEGRHILAAFRQTITYKFTGNKTFVWTSEHELRDVDLSPDFDAPGAFLVSTEIPNGTPVYIDEAPNIPYRWADGRAVKGIDRRVVEATQNATFGDDTPSGTVAIALLSIVGIAAVCVAIGIALMRRRA
jgi:hypothetical protein